MTAGDLDYVDKLSHAIKSIKTTIAMMESEEGESGRYMPRYGYSGDYDRGSYGRRRDIMGRYISGRGGMSYDDGMFADLKELMDRAPDESTRRDFRRLIEKIEKM